MVSLEPLSSSKEYAVNSRQYSFLLTPYCILLTHCCLLRGRFKGKGAVGGMSPFPVAGSAETTPYRSGLERCLLAGYDLHREKSVI